MLSRKSKFFGQAANDCKEKLFMNLGRYAITAVLALAIPAALAQNNDPGPKQDMKNAGSDTKHAATETGHGISHGSKTAYHKTKSGTETGYDKTKSGTKTGYHKTVNGTKTGYHKTAHATKTGVHKVEGKPDTLENNPPR
jgi:hypothetical protein